MWLILPEWRTIIIFFYPLTSLNLINVQLECIPYLWRIKASLHIDSINLNLIHVFFSPVVAKLEILMLNSLLCMGHIIIIIANYSITNRGEYFLNRIMFWLVLCAVSEILLLLLLLIIIMSWMAIIINAINYLNKEVLAGLWCRIDLTLRSRSRSFIAKVRVMVLHCLSGGGLLQKRLIQSVST